MHARTVASSLALSAALTWLVACDKKESGNASASSASAAAATTSTPVAATSAPAATATPSATATATAAEALPTSVTYTTYKNDKFGYSVDVASVFVRPSAFMGQNGQEWKWGDKALMNVAALDAKGKSIKDWHEEAKKESGTTGSSVKDNSFFKTGKHESKIFWQKSVLKGDLLYTVRLEYDESTKTFFDPIVSRASSSFKLP